MVCSVVSTRTGRGSSTTLSVSPYEAITYGLEPNASLVTSDKAIVPGYYDVIKKPMDMNTLKRKLEQDQYANANQFYKDFRQLIENCYTFNPAGTVREAGHKLEEEFNRRWANLPPLRPAEDSEPESEEDDAQSDVEQEKCKPFYRFMTIA